VFGESAGEFGVVTAEDSVLLKLEWFRMASGSLVFGVVLGNGVRE
jgi:hypothetical protein